MTLLLFWSLMIVNMKDLNNMILEDLRQLMSAGKKKARVQSSSQSYNIYVDVVRILIRKEFPLPVITEAIRDLNLWVRCLFPELTKA